MHHVVDLIVRECGVMHRFLPDSAISQAVRIALDQVKHKRPFAEPYILVADFGGPVAPSLPASKSDSPPENPPLPDHSLASSLSPSAAARSRREVLAGPSHWRDPLLSRLFRALRSRPAKPLAARSLLLFLPVPAARPRSDVS